MAFKSKIQVSAKNYFDIAYDTNARWNSYWYQIHEVVKLRPKRLLEIGIGNKTVSDYLKKIGVNVTTCDLDKNLKPDIVGDILDLPFKKDSFDVVLCAEILEHLPFRLIPKSLKQIYKVTSKYAVITLPHFSLANLYLGIKVLPFIPKKELTIKVDFPFNHKFDGQHYWEISKKKYDLKQLRKTFTENGFFIEKDYYPPENPRHHFFILSKKNVKDRAS